MKKGLEGIIRVVFSLLDKLFRNKKYIVFSARAANAYADNSKVVFEHFLSTSEKHNTFYFTKRKEILKNIPKNGIYAYSFKGIFILLQSKILIFTHGTGDFFPYFPDRHPKRKFINLFHAIAVKKVGISGTIAELKEVKKWDYFIVSSQFEKEFIKKQYSFEASQIISLGQARNDIIIRNKNIKKISQTKLILYAPTFRDVSTTILFPFPDVNLEELDKFLISNNLEIMIRMHINEEKNYKYHSDYANLQNIYFSSSNEIPTINDYLHNVDYLITDYSSISLDYLLLDRPIAYIPYDYEDYNNQRGFSFDYHEHLAGPILKSQKNLTSFMLDREDTYSEKRKELKNLFHQHQDGKTQERVYNFIQKIS